MKTSLTTGEVADVCGVSGHTVRLWMEKDLLAGYLLPGSMHRRVRPDELRDFIRFHALPEECLTRLETLLREDA